MTWVTPEEARAFWPDAPLDDEELDLYLGAALEACAAFLNADLSADDPFVPSDGQRLAQVYQARNIWRAVASDKDGTFGPEGLAVSVYPLDWTVRQLLRPKKGRPAIA